MDKIPKAQEKALMPQKQVPEELKKNILHFRFYTPKKQERTT